jgi:cytochrome c551/c552
VPRPRRRNPWTSTGEVLIWVLFAALLIPAGIAGWAVGHYTSLGSSSKTVVHTVTVGATGATTTTTAATTTTTATTTSAGTTTSAAGGGDAAAGKAVFTGSAGCSGCHTFKPANATGTIGPDLDTEPAQSAKADNNMDLAAFIKQSIVDPDAYIAKGYAKGIMPTDFGTKLTATQVNDLVAFILSGTAKS